MDCFDTHYYQLNRKLLLLVGQWPYQDFGDRVKIWILYLCIVMSGMVTQLAKLLTAELDFDLCIEIFSAQLTALLFSVRYFVYTISKEKMKELVDSMRMNWQTLKNNEESEIFGKTAEEGRLHTLYYTMFVFISVATIFSLILAPSLLKYTNLINNSYPRLILYPAEYYVDMEKYYFLIMLHMNLIVSTLVIGALSTDLFLMVFMYHTVGMFKVTGFCDTIVAAYNWPNFVALFIVLINITASLYWGVTSKGEVLKMFTGLLFAAIQMIHMLVIDIPAQLITDCSNEVINKAYSSFWYNAHVKEQSLLLLTMQRSLRPTYVTLGKVHPMSLENYATEVKAAFSYFTMLMSLT